MDTTSSILVVYPFAWPHTRPGPASTHWCVWHFTGAAVQMSIPDVVASMHAACQHTWSGFWTFTSLRVMEMNLPCEEGR